LGSDWDLEWDQIEFCIKWFFMKSLSYYSL
jgi:hypothetical protein